MKAISTYIVLLCFMLFYSCKDKQAIISQLDLEVDTSSLDFRYAAFDKALYKAKEEHKPVLVYVTSDGCAPCLKMEQNVFSDAGVQEFFNSRFVCAKIHIKRTGPVMKSSDFEALNETKVDFLELHEVRLAFPTFLIFDAEGNLIQKVTKFMDASEFVAFGDKAIRRKL